MKKTILLLFVLLALSARAGDRAQYYRDLPFPLPEPEAPVIPDKTVSIKDFGGVGDGIALNTDAFRKAIDALAKAGGGHLVVPAGIWLTGPLVLKDRTDLHLERGALILFSPDKALFFKKDGKGMVPAITASKRKDVSITGEGIIDGNGEWWRAVKRGKVSDVEWAAYRRMGGTVTEDGKLWYPFGLDHYANVAPAPQAQEALRTHLVRFTDCERVRVAGVTLQNSPKFHLVPQRCSQVIFEGITVRCPWNAQNGDGIDIMQSTDVLVAGCTVDVGDDGICTKGGAGAEGVKHGPCRRILIRDNTVFHAHGGFVIGSEFSGGMVDIAVLDNTFSGTDTGLRFKSGPGRGGRTENIVIAGIRMSDIQDEAVVFETGYVNVSVGTEGDRAATQEYLPEFSGIRISDVVCRDARIGLAARGTRAMIHDISLKDCVFFCSEKDRDVADPAMFLLENVRFHTYDTQNE